MANTEDDARAEITRALLFRLVFNIHSLVLICPSQADFFFQFLVGLLKGHTNRLLQEVEIFLTRLSDPNLF